ncbi:PREDICTED: uncharacterized protein LOC106746717 [Dinoponera quadriceps]|uniref:Uncharacterized protein LOC106746717 n=1 Tax=Dinoponera quadriceps TaxID=609295 RepID=A0A6P3XM98_DINQU|nr:PREDICTED: uncharacterized protein LOC106746717 [Dinoponera quadriceps]
MCPKKSQQRSQTQTFYPHTCELLVTNRTENEVSIGRKVCDDTRKVIGEEKMQKLKKDTVCRSTKVDEAAIRITEKVTRQQLQTQVKELHKNIRHFREENAYLQYLIEKCHFPPSERTKVSMHLLLPIRATYRGIATAIEFLRVKCRNGLITMLTNVLQRFVDKYPTNH